MGEGFAVTVEFDVVEVVDTPDEVSVVEVVGCAVGCAVGLCAKDRDPKRSTSVIWDTNISTS